MPTKKELETRIQNLETAQANFHKRLSRIEHDGTPAVFQQLPQAGNGYSTFTHPNAGDSLKGAVAKEIDEANTDEPFTVLFPDGNVSVRRLELVYKSAKGGITLLLCTDDPFDAPISGHIRDASLNDIVQMIGGCIALHFLKKAFPKYRFYSANTPLVLLPGPLGDSDTCDERPYEAPPRDEDVRF